ncbi:MAG TPA: hypothetical protein VMA74_11720, partial [Dyella sp.]|uniref:hypothetical protein n=1 Tax=Dyella sp. TaxID=1869338 RepID=UPI002D129980
LLVIEVVILPIMIASKFLSQWVEIPSRAKARFFGSHNLVGLVGFELLQGHSLLCSESFGCAGLFGLSIGSISLYEATKLLSQPRKPGVAWHECARRVWMVSSSWVD